MELFYSINISLLVTWILFCPHMEHGRFIA